jgi:hypothetical protein
MKIDYNKNPLFRGVTLFYSVVILTQNFMRQIQLFTVN